MDEKTPARTKKPAPAKVDDALDIKDRIAIEIKGETYTFRPLTPAQITAVIFAGSIGGAPALRLFGTTMMRAGGEDQWVEFVEGLSNGDLHEDDIQVLLRELVKASSDDETE